MLRHGQHVHLAKLLKDLNVSNYYSKDFSLYVSGKRQGLTMLTMQDVQLSGPIFTRELNARAFDEIQHYAVGKFLYLHIGSVWRSELAQMVALGALRRSAVQRSQSTQNQESLRIETYVASLP